ncbi:hypothetical protein BASA60_009889 [Batrachochytrium salamandrivorans]|nr:hypothetical protein BASA60_009889 [Batrachochytrium salamandrivorans]
MSIVEPERKKQKLVDLSTKLAIIKHDRVVTRLVVPFFREKAKQIATQIGTDVGEFSVSKDWSQKWKQRNNVQSYKISGESGNVDLAGAEQWKSSLTTMFTGYDLRIVFNMDETGVFL